MRIPWECLLLIGLALASPALGQTNYLWRYWTAQDGVEDSDQRDITFSPAGTVWIACGSVPSISRYDGYSIQNIPCPNDFLTTRGNRGRPIGSMYWKDPDTMTLGGFQPFRNNQWIKYEMDLFAPGIYPVFFWPTRKDELMFLLPERLMGFNAAQRKTWKILSVSPPGMERFSEMIFPSSFGSIALQARGLEGRYAVFADGGKIQRVVGGLVGNAIQYTPEGGEVCIRIEQDRHWVILSVQDTGIGMNPEECGHIFDRFFRSRDSQEMARGSGLGLSIAKELIGLHGGTLTVESEAGAGSTFRMSLPASREEPDHAASHHSDCG